MYSKTETQIPGQGLKKISNSLTVSNSNLILYKYEPNFVFSSEILPKYILKIKFEVEFEIFVNTNQDIHYLFISSAVRMSQLITTNI